MKKILLSLFITPAIMFVSSYAQVYHGGDLWLTTQTQIDTFNYTEVEGNLFIKEESPGTITNLEGLKTLTKISPGVDGEYSIRAGLVIWDNTNLKNLNGLENLKSLLAISISNNGLENLDGLSGISFAQEVSISWNHKLTNINGLSNLDSVSWDLAISDCKILTNIDGLSGLITTHNLFIGINPALENLNGLSNLKTVSGKFSIINNEKLSDINGLSNLDSIGFKTLSKSDLILSNGLVIESNASLTNLDGLSGVTKITGSLSVSGNTALTSLQGLSNVSSVLKGITIKNNTSLENIDGLNKILAIEGEPWGYDIIGGNLIISDNPALTNIDGLSGISSIVESYIRNNTSLININGLMNLKKIRYLDISNNAVLRNLDGLTNLNEVAVTLYIHDNPELTQFCGLYHLFAEGTFWGNRIEGNAENPSREEIISECSPADRSFILVMEGKSEIPKVLTEAAGGGVFVLNNTHDTLSYWISLCDINGITEAHFHNAPQNRTGPVVKNLIFNESAVHGVWTSSDEQPLTSALVNELFGGNIYVEVHTLANPEGEIRGQITSKPLKLYATLTGDQETLPVSTQAKGEGTFILSGNGRSLEYHVIYENLSSPISGAHFHKARSGAAGPVIMPINFEGSSSTGTWSNSDAIPLTPSLVADLIGCSDLYVNIHSENFPEGEIRGQILRQQKPEEFPYMTFWAVNDDYVNIGDGTLYYYTLSDVNYFGNIEGEILLNDPKDIEDLTISDDGTLYIVSNLHTSRLYKIDPGQFDKDPNTPVIGEYIGNTKLPAGPRPDEIASLHFINGTLYGIGKETKKIYSINTATAAITEAGELNVGEFRTDGLVMGADSIVYLLKTVLHGPSEIWKFNDFPGGDISFVTVVPGSGKLESLAAHPNGKLYAADIEHLYEIDIAGNTIGVLDDHTVDIEGMAFNYKAEMLKAVVPVKRFRTIGTITDVTELNTIPAHYALNQNYPNPFNPSTVISYSIPEAAHVKIEVFNSLGELVQTLVNEHKAAGNYTITFNSETLPSGVYICKIKAGGFSRSNKMILLR